MDGDPILEFREVARSFAGRRHLGDWLHGRPAPRLRAVAGVSLSVRRGETLGIVGESGCGKSTLARIAAGLHRPDGGEVRLEGRRLDGPDPSGRVQMVFQDPYSSLDPRMTIGAQLAEVIGHYRPDLGRGARAEAVQARLAQVGLVPEIATRAPRALSGGQRQRVSIARALCAGPELIVADEPVSALDASVQAQIINLFQRLSREAGITTLFISHDMHVVRHLCDRVAVMYLGEIVELQETAALFADPRHPYTRGLIAAVPDPARRGLGPRPALEGEIPDPFARPEGCRFAPRCPLAEPACAAAQPLCPDGRGGAVRCWKTAAREPADA